MTRRNVFLVTLDESVQSNSFILIRTIRSYYSSASFQALARFLFTEFQKRVSNVTERPANGQRGRERRLWPNPRSRLADGERAREMVYALAENSFSFGIVLDYVHVHSVTYSLLTKHFRMTRLEYRENTRKYVMGRFGSIIKFLSSLCIDLQNLFHWRQFYILSINKYLLFICQNSSWKIPVGSRKRRFATVKKRLKKKKSAIVRINSIYRNLVQIDSTSSWKWEK